MSRRVDRITDEAAVWYVRAQDPDFSTSDREELASWLAGSAEHVLEYLSLAAVTHEVREVTAGYDIDAIVQLARESADDANVVVLLGPEVASSSRETMAESLVDIAVNGQYRRRPGLWATAATVLIAATLGVFHLTAPDPDFHSTGVGEQVSFPLDDGSVITLNAQSTLRVDYREDQRNIRLTAGEAMFNVAKDPDRPFRVSTERAVIQAIGTQFNVRHRGADTTVTVVEGIVDVQSTASPHSLPDSLAQVPTPNNMPAVVPETMRITVGQQVRVGRGEIAVFNTNVEKVTSWRERRLVFEKWELKDVVQEFNLYNDHQFVIDDPTLATRAISGAFSADDRESFALFLREARLAVSETRNDGTIVLRAAHEDR